MTKTESKSPQNEDKSLQKEPNQPGEELVLCGEFGWLKLSQAKHHTAADALLRVVPMPRVRIPRPQISVGVGCVCVRR